MAVFSRLTSESSTSRSASSVKSRWNNVLLSNVHKFISHRQLIGHLNPTGVIDAERLEMEIRKYSGLSHKEISKVGKFLYMAAYKSLLTAPKSIQQGSSGNVTAPATR